MLENVDRFWLKLSKNIKFGQILLKIWILDKIEENVDYSQNFRKMSILAKICKYFDFGQNLLKSRFWTQFMKISILVKIVEKILILVNIFGKSRF